MAVLTDSEGRNLPLIIDGFRYYSIAEHDLSPAEDPSSDFTDSEASNMLDKGFLVMPHASGTIYGIQWRDYFKNDKSLTGLVPEIYKGTDGVWIPCRFVKIFASDDSTYPSTCTTLNYDVPL